MTYRQHKDAYLTQRQNAKRRGIPWHFNYVSWWRKWCESGKWKLRGKECNQYVMSRPRDKGPYSYENTKICTFGENSSEKVFTKEYRAKMSAAHMGIKPWNLGKKHTLKSRRKMSLAHIGNTSRRGIKASLETKEKMSKAHVGKKHSEETRAKMSKALLGNKHWLGKKHSVETRKKMSKSAKVSQQKRKECYDQKT